VIYNRIKLRESPETKGVHDMKKKYIANCSGGKDSVAMIDMIIEKGLELDEIVFAKVEKEFYFEDLMRKKLIERWSPIVKCTVLQCETTWDEWFFGTKTRGKTKGKRRGFPITLYPCYWTREAKVKILNKHIGDNYSYIGYAINEKSPGRKKMILNYIENGYKNIKEPNHIYPLIEWEMKEEDCLEYCKDNDILNMGYKYFDRLGCYLCPKQNVKNLKVMITFFHAEWEELKRYTKACDTDEFVDKGCFKVNNKEIIDYEYLIKLENEMRY